jgi:hypothetical protein
MGMKLLRARDVGDRYRFRVHLDTTKLIDGEPDPAYVRDYEWTRTGMTLVRIKDELRLRAQADLDAIAPPEGTPVSGEGGTL